MHLPISIRFSHIYGFEPYCFSLAGTNSTSFFLIVPGLVVLGLPKLKSLGEPLNVEATCYIISAH